MRASALLLDLDDTLLDYSGGVDECWEAACTEAASAARLDVPAFLPVLADSRRWFWSDADRHRRERVDMVGAWTQIVAHALARVGIEADGLAGRIAEDFGARRRSVMRLFPDTIPTLEALRARGVPLALVTNGDKREQRDKIERHGLAPYFDAIVIEGELGAGKPEPAVYHHALDALGVTAEGAWMAGDHLEFDVGAPQRLGLRGAWIDRAARGLPSGSAVNPECVLAGVAALVEIVAPLAEVSG